MTQALELLCFAVAAAVFICVAVRSQRSAWRKKNRRRPGVMSAPSDKCHRNGTECVP